MNVNEPAMRLDPLRQTWTIYSTARALQPQLSAQNGADSDLPSPFMAGLEKFTGNALHEKRHEDQWQVRVVPNRTPILKVEGDPKRHRRYRLVRARLLA